MHTMKYDCSLASSLGPAPSVGWSAVQSPQLHPHHYSDQQELLYTSRPFCVQLWSRRSFSADFPAMQELVLPRADEVNDPQHQRNALCKGRSSRAAPVPMHEQQSSAHLEMSPGFLIVHPWCGPTVTAEKGDRLNNTPFLCVFCPATSLRWASETLRSEVCAGAFGQQDCPTAERCAVCEACVAPRGAHAEPSARPVWPRGSNTEDT
mmetsp:Transcript_65305/g.168079  ORF Transcript_65305/g.168079 Transcript_65305/m.168079 type:complete len:207 (+) Transcript_65305:244-864(+)